MKCPLCAAQTDIKETRHKNGKFVRRRECYNYHTFLTEEIAITMPKLRRSLKKTETKGKDETLS